MELTLKESDLERLAQWDRPVPRYTSYPPAPSWGEISAEVAQTAWKSCNRPIGIYMHVPFCHSMCLFCGCSVVLNRRPDRQQYYVDTLLEEMRLLASHAIHRFPVAQIHLGGGTPTVLTAEQFIALIEGMHHYFDLSALEEMAIEVDPRTVVQDGGHKLRLLKELGFDRVSFGVQDADPRVQEAIRRRQSWKCSLETLQLARRLGFKGINLDLIYGLPYQTIDSFGHTAQLVAEALPDRIALFSYAHVPWLKRHQRALELSTLPMGIDKLRLYLAAREVFLSAGYRAIGMDHFALPNDPLVQALDSGTLHRNFQGYAVRIADDLMNLGMSAIGQVGPVFLQNAKDLETYQNKVWSGALPTEKGLILDAEDLQRQKMIQEIMCRFTIDLQDYSSTPQQWCEEFSKELKTCNSLQEEGLLKLEGSRLTATGWGRLVIRNIAKVFDRRTPDIEKKFSQAL